MNGKMLRSQFSCVLQCEFLLLMNIDYSWQTKWWAKWEREDVIAMNEQFQTLKTQIEVWMRKHCAVIHKLQQQQHTHTLTYNISKLVNLAVTDQKIDFKVSFFRLFFLSLLLLCCVMVLYKQIRCYWINTHIYKKVNRETQMKWIKKMGIERNAHKTHTHTRSHTCVTRTSVKT